MFFLRSAPNQVVAERAAPSSRRRDDGEHKKRSLRLERELSAGLRLRLADRWSRDDSIATGLLRKIERGVGPAHEIFLARLVAVRDGDTEARGHSKLPRRDVEAKIFDRLSYTFGDDDRSVDSGGR